MKAKILKKEKWGESYSMFWLHKRIYYQIRSALRRWDKELTL